MIDDFLFSSETSPEEPHQRDNKWRILAVDDDVKFQNSLSFAINKMTLMGRPLELIQAYSMAEASSLLGKDADFAVVLVDVVMETEDAGLRLVKAVRDLLGISDTRFVLLTGQPGMAPAESVMQDYDLSDYVLKSDLASRGIRNILTGAVRNYHQLKTISSARRGLQLIVESSNRLLGLRTLAQIASVTLSEIANLIDVPDEGLVCVNRGRHSADGSGQEIFEPMTIACSGRFRQYANRALRELPDPTIQSMVEQALREKRFVSTDESQVLFFPKSAALAEFAIYVATDRTLDDTEMELLKVFAANVSKGFGNVALISRLDKIAYQDELLGIPNRSALLRELSRLQAMSSASAHNLLLLDLDHFSGLNNLFGSVFGNQVLQAVAQRLQEVFPQPTVIGRLHSDLFAVVGHKEQVNIDRAQRVFSAPFEIDNSRHILTACMTEVSLAISGQDPAELLRTAGTGLRNAKSRGPGSIQAFDPEFEHQAAHRFKLMQRLHTAIQRQEFVLHFQPQIDLKSGEVVGVEALLRWQTEDGMVPPGTFIPLAEQSSYIHGIGDIVVALSCQAVHALDQAGFTDILVSLNYSARQLDKPDVLDRLKQQCRLAGVEPSRLCLEVTETAMMQSFQQVAKILQRHRAWGGTVAIDDFGTGLSSLEYLLQLPADHLKIDMTFVARLDEDERSRFLASMIIELGRRLNISVVAEGVETRSQANWLRDNGCHIAQGWLYGKAMPLDELLLWLSKR
ncbi:MULTISPECIES: GGDEF/EAL domain-containing response regulator [Shewanella]|uniref:GGDEF/EAL domain-containing response regulator n=1 Tax=Shewanella TaxID=22 RepID=UPI0011841683|nr:EAL domain-containing protein [Shewanella algae]EKT4486240.1 EAL domain-containing protein [Shewanella algae]MBO2547792.1 EAL domain-containing protein [Shewanella algae]MBO2612033.1 EAL domain-containing protein [Shewanella algae]MBO2632891.1 EAL domain-containing protein [Shewanella algae]TVK97761.1 hypothetical protein AYI83_10000 [Shewanella algae]